MSLDLNLAPTFKDSGIYPAGSVDGLLCLHHFGRGKDNTTVKKMAFHICNPITREYMILPSQQCQQYCKEGLSNVVYCFGVVSLTREYKLIQIFQNLTKPDFTSTFELSLSEADVYTLGTGRWRSLGHVPYRFNGWNGTFLKGHAHWTLECRNNLPETLCAFDFDKETFELFPSPPYEEAIKECMAGRLDVLNGCLCRCDCYESNLTVWVMKEYGIKNSWHKDLVIKYSTIPDLDRLDLKPWYLIQGYKDGTIFMGTNGGTLVIYCPRRNIVVEREIFDSHVFFTASFYRPSFQRLHNFENENVHVF